VGIEVRPLVEADVEAAALVQIDAFDEHDRRLGDPVPDVTPERIEWTALRIRHFLTHDPHGSWVADDAGRITGVALALRRDRLWGLSLLVVDPRSQSGGVGRRLLDAALAYAEPGSPAVILSSRDPRAIRLYASSGFDLHPQIRAAGVIKPARLKTPELPVRDGTAADFDLADAVDVVVRGAARGCDHEMLAAGGPMFVVDSGEQRGYAFLRGGRVATIAATDVATASALLWRCLSHAADLGVEAEVDHVPGNQQWAVRAAIQAGLLIRPIGPVFWRGCSPPAAYLPSGAYL
jgi:GNAT superfamily N-acetyltransferase